VLRAPVKRTLAVDALMVAYLAGTAILLTGLQAPGAWLGLRAVVLMGIALARLGRLPAWLHLHYPLPLCFLLYLELDHYGPLTGGIVYDEPVLALEERLFGSSPAVWLSQRLPWRPLSELLHLGYLSFYLMAPALLLALRHEEEVALVQRAGAAVWVASFVCFIFFPVEGPRPRLEPLDPALQGPCYALCHWLSGTGAARAAAFPSVHAGLATLVWLLAWRWRRRLAWALLPFTLALLLGTVYGRFHYAVDSLAGMLLALACARSANGRSGGP
jgi:membrane-associated phospholipid phosphatase